MTRATPASARAALALLAGLGVAAPAEAHHEAIFGPQSSLLSSADRFVSLQAFSRQTGTRGSRTQESTGLVSAGFSPVKRLPLTVTAILPYSVIDELDGPGRDSGAEDAILGLRYRWGLGGLKERWGKEGNFVTVSGAFELNNGRIDHRSWTGPADWMGGLLGSLERGRWSGIGYAFGRHNGKDATQSKAGDSLFLGTGAAYTPNEDGKTGRLVSYQLGASYELYDRDTVDGVREERSGGQELLLHPTVAASPGHGVLLFALVSLPVWRDFRDPSAQDRFRVGTGIVWHW